MWKGRGTSIERVFRSIEIAITTTFSVHMDSSRWFEGLCQGVLRQRRRGVVQDRRGTRFVYKYVSRFTSSFFRVLGNFINTYTLWFGLQEQNSLSALNV